MKVFIGEVPETSDDEDQRIEVQIDPWDTWSMDYTLSHIIHPMLIQLKETKHGSPYVEDEDVPEAIRSTSAKPKENEWDVDEFFHERWNYVMDEMIWAFAQIKSNAAAEEFYNDGKFDHNSFHKNQKRVSNGCRLFGQYFQSLWD